MTVQRAKDIRGAFNDLKTHKLPKESMAYRELVASAIAAVDWVKGYIRVVEEAIERSDLTTFKDPRGELVIAKNELAELDNLRNDISAWIKSA